MAGSTGERPRRASKVLVAAVAAGALGTALQSTGSAGVPSAPDRSAAAAATADVVPAERRALCELRPAAIRRLLSGLPGDEGEALRDAVWLLEDRVEQWRSGGEGLPQAAAPVRLAEDVENAWREALQRHDSGDSAGRRAALSRAEARLGELDRVLRAAPVPGC